jgi:D-psicose/D-tagatose/L-ribulose 3-epimerase
LCGPFYQPLGVFTGEGPSEEEKQRAAEVHQQASDYAAKANVTLAVEFLNRFECYLLNTMADTAEFVKRVNRPNYGVLYDTFHSHIEEKDPVGCIAPNIDIIKHVHISENDRGTPGRGQVNWSGTFKALRSAGYDGWLTVEAFGRALPALVAATKVWRDLSTSPDEVYTEGLKLIKEQWEAAA